MLGAAFVIGAAAGCNVYETARSDQALGQGLGVGAWVDPALMPVQPCAALHGSWSNRGNLVRDGDVRSAALTTALGLADKFPDSAFADEVSFSRDADGALTLTARKHDHTLATYRIQANASTCDSDGITQFELGGIRRVGVDAVGSLWLGEHRFPETDVPRCKNVGWTISSPDGMATVVPGAGAILLEPDDTEQRVLVKSTALSMGVRVPPTGVFYLPGTQSIDVRVHLQPQSRWQFAVPYVTRSISATLSACHSYLLLGGSDADDTLGDSAWATLVDMGEDFDWRSCPSTPGSTRVVIEAESIRAHRYCFLHADSDRTFPLTVEADR